MVSVTCTSLILFSVSLIYCILVEGLMHEEPEIFYSEDRQTNFVTDDFDYRYPNSDDSVVEVTKRDANRAMISSLGEHRAIIEEALDRYGRTYPMKKIPRISRYQIQYNG